MNTEDIKNMTTAYLQVLEESSNKKERPYVVFHAKKGKYETNAVSSYDAAKNAAKHWKLKSTAGITPKLADVTHVATESQKDGMDKKKLDPVDKNALKGDHDDREDGDIDNDGDIDASDEYLHNRRKTIKKSMKDESYGNVTPKMAKGVMMGKGSNLPKINKGVKMGKPIAAKSEEVKLDELSPATLKSYKKKAMTQYKQSANKRMPGGGDYGSATKAAQDKHQKRFDKRHKGIGSEIKRTTDSDIHLKDPKGLVRKNPKSNSMTGKPAPYKNKAESYVAENRWPIYNKIMENRDMQTKGATEPEGMYSKSSEGEKAFIAMHTPNGAVDPKFDANVAAEKTAQSIANSVKPGTGNEAASNAVPGDKMIRK
jgi:hypothetical protein